MQNSNPAENQNLPDPVKAEIAELVNKFEAVQWTGAWTMAQNANPTVCRDFLAALVAFRKKYLGE